MDPQRLLSWSLQPVCAQTPVSLLISVLHYQESRTGNSPGLSQGSAAGNSRREVTTTGKPDGLCSVSVTSCSLLETLLQATARPTALSGLVG